MLVLTRKENERIMIGNDVVITIVRVIGDNVRLGIEAPRNLEVHREEVFREIQKQRSENKPE